MKQADKDNYRGLLVQIVALILADAVDREDAVQDIADVVVAWVDECDDGFYLSEGVGLGASTKYMTLERVNKRLRGE